MIDADSIKLRTATADDAEVMAEIIDETSEGILRVLLEDQFPGVDRCSLLAMALRDETTHYSYKNIILAEAEDRVVGLLFAYHSRFQGVTDLLKQFIPKNRICQVEDVLTACVEDTLYINTLWVDKKARGIGLADALIEIALENSREIEAKGLSLHCWQDNTRALAFYRRQGFVMVRPIASGSALSERHKAGGCLLQFVTADKSE